jgi:hypothetical protein
VSEFIPEPNAASFIGRIARRGAGPGSLAAAVLLSGCLTLAAPVEASSLAAACSLSTLHFTLETNDGLGHGAYRVLVANLGTARCTLSGYPRVRVPLFDHLDRSVQPGLQRVMPPGSVATVSDMINSYAGGYLGPVTESGRVPLPVVDLKPRTGHASFNIVWIEMSSKPCPVAQTLELGLTGDAKFWTTRRMTFVCSSVDVTPFVNGTSGSWGLDQ